MIRTKKAPPLRLTMLSGLKAGALTGLLGAAVYSFFIFKTTYSRSIVDSLYAYYAYNYSTGAAPALTQAQFVTLELFLFATAPVAVGIPIGPVVALIFHRTRFLEKTRMVQAIVALTTFWVAQVLYGYLLLPSAYGVTFLELWIPVSFFTALPFWISLCPIPQPKNERPVTMFEITR